MSVLKEGEVYVIAMHWAAVSLVSEDIEQAMESCTAKQMR